MKKRKVIKDKFPKKSNPKVSKETKKEDKEMRKIGGKKFEA